MIGWVPAHPEEGPALQHPEQLHLGGRRDLADLVEEDGPGVGQLEPAQPPLGGAGEGALLVPEQLRLQQRLGQRGAVDRDERPAPPGREVVDRLGDQLLAGAALALDQHRARHRRHLLDLDQHLLDRRALADDAGALLEPAPLDQPPRGLHHLLGPGRLHHRLGDAEPADPLRPLGVGGLEQGEGRDLGVPGQGGELSAWGSWTAPVRITRSGFSRRTDPRASSSEENMAVENPAPSSAALSGTAVSSDQ